jgi:hypothetical protein
MEVKEAFLRLSLALAPPPVDPDGFLSAAPPPPPVTTTVGKDDPLSHDVYPS